MEDRKGLAASQPQWVSIASFDPWNREIPEFAPPWLVQCQQANCHKNPQKSTKIPISQSQPQLQIIKSPTPRKEGSLRPVHFVWPATPSMSSCAYAHGLLEEEEKPLMNKCLGKWYLSVLMFATMVLAVVFCLIAAIQTQSKLPSRVDEQHFTFIQELHNLSLVWQVRQPTMEGAGVVSEVLIEDDGDFSELMTSETVPFEDIETGVLTMANYVAHYNTIAIGPSQKTFWAPLLNENTVHHIFREKHEALHNIQPTDLNIVEAVSILYTIAASGTEIESNKHVAYSFNLMTFVVVTTSPVDGALSNAWAIQGPRDQGILIDRAVGIVCAKTFVEEIGLGYTCVPQTYEIKQQFSS